MRYTWHEEAEEVETVIDLEEAATDEAGELVRTVQALLQRDLSAQALAAAARRTL